MENDFVEFMLKKANTKEKPPEPYRMPAPRKEKSPEAQRTLSEEEMREVEAFTEDLKKRIQQNL